MGKSWAKCIGVACGTLDITGLGHEIQGAKTKYCHSQQNKSTSLSPLKLRLKSQISESAKLPNQGWVTMIR